MKKISFRVIGQSPLSFNKYVSVPKLDKELPDDYEKRTWRDRLHVDASGNACIPAIAIQKSIAECAKFMSRKIPGKGQATWTKHFEAGLIMTSSTLSLGIRAEDVEGVWVHVPADGVSGSGKRVMKCFPTIPTWEFNVEMFLVDDTITLEEFQYTVEQAGLLIGIGSYRPRNKGTNGRFEIRNLKFEDKK